MGGGDLNTKKSWHPNTMKNQERVWKAEQAEANEKRRIDDLRREMDSERSREELTLHGQSSGVLAENSSKKMDWMYKQPHESVDREQYLLGKKIDKTFEKIISEEKVSQSYVRPPPPNHVEHECIPFSIRNWGSTVGPEDCQVDMARKLLEDPLVAIRKRELESRAQLLQNPVKLKELTMLLKKDQAETKRKKDKKKNKKHKKESSDIDKKLAEKLNKLRSTHDDQLDIKGLLQSPSKSIKSKSVKKKKKKSKSSSSESEEEESTHKEKQINRKRAGEFISEVKEKIMNRSQEVDRYRPEERQRNRPEARYRNTSEDRDKITPELKDRNKSGARNRSEERDKNNPGARYRAEERDKNNPGARYRAEERDKNKPGANNRSEERDRNKQGAINRSEERDGNRPGARNRSEERDRNKPGARNRSEERNRNKPGARNILEERNRNKSGGRNRSEERDRIRSDERYRNRSRDRSEERDRNKPGAKNRSEERNIIKPDERYKNRSQERDRYTPDTRDRNRSVERERNKADIRDRSRRDERDHRSEENNKNKPEKRSEAETYKRKNHGKQHYDESKKSSESIQPSHSGAHETPVISISQRRYNEDSDDDNERPKQKNYGLVRADGSKMQLNKTEKHAPAKLLPSKEVKKFEKARPVRLTEAEKEERRKEMMEDASKRDKEREQYVTNYRVQEKKREAMDKNQKYKDDFVEKHLREAAKFTSVESRIKSNIYNIQRSNKHMDTNFAKR